MIRLFIISPHFQALSLPKMSSLDEISQQLPQGLYTTFRTYGNKTRVLGFTAHLERLHKQQVAFDGESIDQHKLRKTIREVLTNFPEDEARIRLHIATTNQPGYVFLSVEPLRSPDKSVYDFGVKASTTDIERKTPRLKTTAFIQNSHEQRQLIVQKGFYESLMIKKGHILEGITSNFYGVSREKIFTARYDILLGVTRRYVLMLARRNKIEIQYTPVHVNQLAELEEAFITSSGRGVVPIISIDNNIIANGKVGNITKLLREKYDGYVIEKAEKI